MASSDEITTFNPLGNYEWPVRPAEESLRRMAGDLWRTFRRKNEPDPFISDESLRWTNRSRLNEIAAPPACGPVLSELQATFAEWIADQEPSHWLQLVVLPPCDQNDIVRSWALVNDHVILEPPARDSILDPESEFELPEIRGDGVIVVPRLEHWFLRHHNGLREVRTLLHQLSRLQRHCVIGCNSWAWGFLSKVANADSVFPCGLTFEAFHAARLRRWFSELASEGEDRGRTFRSSIDGKDVFAASDQKETPSDFFFQLAARSFGIPWVAWHLWRRSIRLGPDQDQGAEPMFADEETLWIAALEDFKMPKQDVDSALLLLQALLIHDTLTAEQIDLVVPLGGVGVLASLVRAGFVLRQDQQYACAPAAYHVIRTQLDAAGFPMDQL
ncbi:hypothetical protein [Rubripirellula reticaptiva]|nr:hypothetical protein [Rubripirellula reticaptiva]